MNILFIVPYPLKQSPSQRFRFEQYFEILANRGHRFHVQSFLDDQTWQIFFKPGRIFKKGLILLKGFARRFAVLFTLPKYDFIFIHREAAPLGPPIFEWIIANIFGKKIIYDYDDAIWLTDREDESRWLKLIKWRSKVKLICGWSYKVSCGNHYLCNYARQFSTRVVYNPTTIDTQNVHNASHFKKRHDDTTTVIGWTGSHSTLKYLQHLEQILADLERTFSNVKVMVIADRKPNLNLNSLIFKPWSLETEIDDLFQADIGIMPLPDDEWSKGKCGFKALQYMALAIPTVASPVGVNTAIIQHGINGFLASSSEEWKIHLHTLIADKALRTKIGVQGQKTVLEHYSVSSNASTFLSLFDLS